MGFIGTGYFLAVSFGPLLVTQIADRTNLQVLFLVYTVLAAVGVGHAAFSLEPDPKHDRIAGSWSDFLEVGKSRAFWGIVIVQSFFTLGVVPMIQYFGNWLESIHGMDTQARGLIFAIGGIPILAGSPVGGWISDRIGNKPFFVLVTGALACLVCVMPYMDSSRAGVILAFSAVGFTAAARYSSYHALATRLIGEELLGHLLAFRNFLNYLVTGAGVVVMGYVYESGDGSGYLYLGWIASLMLFLSIPFLITMIPREPSVDPSGKAE
jgi:predicted MFS family arabinose efflux permease